MLTVGILQCTEFMPELASEHGSYAAMFRCFFSAAAAAAGSDIAVTTYDVCGCMADSAVEHVAGYPREKGECDVYVVTGSPSSAFDSDEWIATLGEFIRELHSARHPMIGICFGHQMIALALGGAVAQHSEWGAGVLEYRTVARRSWMQPPLETMRVCAMHQDQVVELPPRAARLASNPLCANAAFEIGAHVVCMQPHPELTKPYVASLVKLREDRFEARKPGSFGPIVQSLELELTHDAVGLWLLKWAEAAVVAGSRGQQRRGTAALASKL
eukprot:SAG22_NODE_3438_length_1712_cov_2.257285_1_plen_272_part_00